MATIMVVDDELIILQMIASLIEDLGHCPLLASDGRAALGVLNAAHELPALIISDLMMPHINGVALAQVVKTSPRLWNIPFVLMSAACHADQARVADYFLPKPFEFDEIEELMQRYADETKPRTLPLDMPNLIMHPPMEHKSVVRE